MNRVSLSALFIITVLLSVPSWADKSFKQCVSPNKAALNRAIENSQQLVDDYIKQHHLVGLTIAISHCDKTLWSQGFGVADIENNVPVSTQSKFRIASISKTLTATALGLLHAQGKLDLDKDIRHYLPEFPKKRHVVTTRQLAGHLAGIRSYKGDEMLISRHYDQVIDGLAIFQDDPLIHAPGTAYHYSSHGWNLLSAVIERAAGQPYLDYMRQQVLSPMGMHNTLADQTSDIIKHRAHAYQVAEDGSVNNAPFVDNSYKWAGGGYLANAEDLLLFGQAMLTNQLLKPQTFKVLTKAMANNQGQSTQYGMGWSHGLLDKNKAKLRTQFGDEVGSEVFDTLETTGLLGHSGGAIGGKAYFWILPKHQLTLAVMSNSNKAPTVAFNVTAQFVKLLDAAASHTVK